MIKNLIILDSGVFRKVTTLKSDERSGSIRGISNYLDKLIPAQVSSSLPLFPEYVGIKKDERKYKSTGDFTALAQFDDLAQFHQRMFGVFSDLLNALDKREALQGPAFATAAAKQLKHSDRTITHSYRLAENILHFRGCSSSWEERALEYRKFLALDGVLYHMRSIPHPICFDAFTEMIKHLPKWLDQLSFFPLYRLVDSLIQVIKQIPDPDDLEKRLKKNLSPDHLNPVNESESADCWTIGLALHGQRHKESVLPVTLISFDKQLIGRLQLAVEVLMVKVENEPLLISLRKNGLLNPGEILVFDKDNADVEPEILNVSQLITSTLTPLSRRDDSDIQSVGSQ